MEFKVEIFQVRKIIENDLGMEKSWSWFSLHWTE